jgi:hypothetical protein
MSRKPKTVPAKKEQTREANLPEPPYPSLREGPTPAERRAKLEAQAEARGCKPMTEEELDQWIEEFRDLWPSDEEIDEFVAWVHKCRREGQY